MTIFHFFLPPLNPATSATSYFTEHMPIQSRCGHPTTSVKAVTQLTWRSSAHMRLSRLTTLVVSNSHWWLVKNWRLPTERHSRTCIRHSLKSHSQPRSQQVTTVMIAEATWPLMTGAEGCRPIATTTPVSATAWNHTATVNHNANNSNKTRMWVSAVSPSVEVKSTKHNFKHFWSSEQHIKE